MIDDQVKKEARRTVRFYEKRGSDKAYVLISLPLFKALLELAERPHD